ncbi:MAG: MlaD family protein [Desulfobacteraceae bacterium]|jgi:paraquat-inducible protein B|nr:MlaD family protein [Desulfobacteraceae bacterium]
MSKQANKTAIGVFVVGAVVLAVAAIIVFGSGKFFVKTDFYVVYLPGSVKGLRIGAPVMFRGVKIGEVTQIRLYSVNKGMSIEIPVIFSVDPASVHSIGSMVEAIFDDKQQEMDAMIEKGLRARMEMQSFVTGQRMINLDYYPHTPVRLMGEKGIELGDDIIEIPTIKTIEQEIGKTLEDIPIGEVAESLQNSMKGIERFVTSEEFTKSLHYFKQTLKEARNLVRHVDEKVDPLFVDVELILKEAQAMLRNVNSQIDPLSGSIMKTAEDARKMVNNVNKQVQPIQANLANTTKSLQATLEEIDGIVSENSEFRYQIDIFLREIALAARSLRSFADYLERNPDALIRGKQRREVQK